MNDIVGQPLAIGDVVAFPNGSGSANSLRLGQIIRMGVKMAIVTVVQDPNGRNGGEYRRYFTDVMKIPS